MTELQIGLSMIGLMVFLVIAGMNIGVVLLSLSFVGVGLARDNWGLAERMLSLALYSGISDYMFATIPLFVLMGMLVSVADIGKETFEVLQVLLRRVVGGLAIATVAANTVFASITGISIASAAVFTRIAVPEMIKNGYSPHVAVGTVAGSSILGMLIPPSLLLIIYGVVAEQSIGQLFKAAIIPGVIMAIAFCLGLVFLAVYCKSYTFSCDANTARVADAPSQPLTPLLLRLFPVSLLVVLMLGGLYTGVFTPTEAGGVGAAGAFFIALMRRKINWKSLWRVLVETGVVSVSILFLLIAANLYSRMLAMAGIADFATDTMSGLGPWGFLFVYILIVISLGMILDSSSMILIMVPLAVPIAQTLGFDLIHFGIITVIAVEIGLLTPPLGLSAFAVKSSLDDPRITLGTIFVGCIPFVLIMLAVLLLLILVPQLVTILL